MADLKIRVGAALDTNFSQVFRPMVRAAKDARRQVQDELNSLSPNRRVAYGFYKELVDGARQARRVIEDILAGVRIGGGVGGGFGGGLGALGAPYAPAVNAARMAVNEQREAARKAAREQRERERLAARERREQERQADRVRRVLGNLTGEGVQVAGLDRVRDKFLEISRSAKSGLSLRALASEAEKELRKVERAAARTALGLDKAAAPKRNLAYRMGYWAQQNFSPTVPMLSVGRRVMSDIASGAGLRVDLGGMVASRVEAEKMATAISSGGYMPQEPGPNEKRVDPRELMKQATEEGNRVAMAPTAMLAGLDTFVGLTGDLSTGREIMTDLAKLARATGSSFDDIMAAAGNAANQFDGMAGKADLIRATLAATAGQGKLGAVEIKDMAVQMAAVAAAATRFSGDAKDNVILMGAIAQEARYRGGAKSAPQAATIVGSFANTFTKAARVKAFQAEGIDVFDTAGKVRNPEEIILEALDKTGGDNVRMGKMFMDSNARKAVLGFESVYRDAGGGKSGLEAVVKEFDRLKKGVMASREINDSFAASMQTTEAKAQLFQNKLNEVVATMADRVLPKLLEMQPLAERLMRAVAGLVEWAVDNPFKAVATALAASIGKAGIEQVLRVGVESLFSGYDRGAGIGGGAGLLGNLSAGFAIASLAVTAMTVGMMAIDEVAEKKSQRTRDEVASDLTAGNVRRQAAAEFAKTGAVSPETMVALKDAEKKLVGQIGVAEGPKSWGENFFNMFGVFTPDAAQAEARLDRERIDGMREELAKLHQLMSGKLQVEVTNMPPPSPVPTSVRDLPRTGPLGEPVGYRRMGEM